LHCSTSIPFLAGGVDLSTLLQQYDQALNARIRMPTILNFHSPQIRFAESTGRVMSDTKPCSSSAFPSTLLSSPTLSPSTQSFSRATHPRLPMRSLLHRAAITSSHVIIVSAIAVYVSPRALNHTNVRHRTSVSDTARAVQFVTVSVYHRYYTLAATAALLKYIEFFENILFVPRSLKFSFDGAEKTTIIDSATARNLELVYSLKVRSYESPPIDGVCLPCIVTYLHLPSESLSSIFNTTRFFAAVTVGSQVPQYALWSFEPHVYTVRFCHLHRNTHPHTHTHTHTHGIFLALALHLSRTFSCTRIHSQSSSSRCGARLLRAEILQPPCDGRTSVIRHDAVAELLARADEMAGLRHVLRREVDIDRVLSGCIQLPRMDEVGTAEGRIDLVIMVRWAVVEIDDVLAFGEFQHLSPCISLHWPVLDVSIHPSGDIRVPSCPHNRHTVVIRSNTRWSWLLRCGQQLRRSLRRYSVRTADSWTTSGKRSTAFWQS
jgi:hypothetical protein